MSSGPWDLSAELVSNPTAIGKRVSFNLRVFENVKIGRGEDRYTENINIYNASMEDDVNSTYLIKYIESVLERVTGKKVTISVE